MELNVVYLYITAFSPMRQKKTNFSSNQQFGRNLHIAVNAYSNIFFLMLSIISIEHCFQFGIITFVVKLYETCLNGILSLMHSD